MAMPLLALEPGMLKDCRREGNGFEEGFYGWEDEGEGYSRYGERVSLRLGDASMGEMLGRSEEKG